MKNKMKSIKEVIWYQLDLDDIEKAGTLELQWAGNNPVLITFGPEKLFYALTLTGILKGQKGTLGIINGNAFIP